MRRITLQMYITLDGRNEFPTYPGSGDPPANESDPVSEEMWVNRWDTTDTLLFDEETYGQWADFWPLSKRTPDEHPWYRQMAEFAERAQKVVFSLSTQTSAWANTRTLTGDLGESVDRLRKESGKNMAVVSPGLARELMRRGLIDDYFFAVFPVILGKGPPLFGDLEVQQTLQLAEVKHFKHGELFLHYTTLREQDA